MIKTTLGLVADIITGPFGSSLHQYEYVSFGIPVIMPQDIGNRNLSYEKIAYITQEKANELSRYLVDTNDIVYARRGDIEKHAFITDNDKGAICGTGCLRVRIIDKTVNPIFLSFYLNKPETKKWISLHAVGSNMPNINTEILSKVPIVLPDKKEQDSIASFLDSIDNKISNNNDICSDLEGMAKLLYNYWFVQFDFPDENGKPYKSSGGKMVWNEELKREIPYGWEVLQLNDCVDTIIDHRGKTPKKMGGDWSKKGEGVMALSAKIIKGNRLNNLDDANWITESMYKNWMKTELKDGDILMTSEAPLGEFYYLKGFTRYCLSQRLFAIRADKETILPSYLFLYLSKGLGYHLIINKQSGSTVFGIRQDELRQVNILIPPLPIQKRFCSVVDNGYSQLRNLEHENQQLASLRDFLLPMLMNGQVKVKKEAANE